MRISNQNGDTKPLQIPPPPGHLSKKMKEFWVWAHRVKELDEKHRLLLTKAAEAFDESERCRRQIKKDGLVVLDRFKQAKPHPLIVAEQSSRAQFSKLLEQLYLYNLHEPVPWTTTNLEKFTVT